MRGLLHAQAAVAPGTVLSLLVLGIGSISGCNCCPNPGPDAGEDGGADGMSDTAGPNDVTDAATEDGTLGCDAGGRTVCGASCVDTSVDDENCGQCGHACTGAMHCGAGACRISPIEHVVLIVQENHTFDTYFGRYCTAPAHSEPSCTSGRPCCEAAPATEPKGASPGKLDDATNFGSDRNHEQGCELLQIDDGAMDGYVTGSSWPCKNSNPLCCVTSPSCSDPGNWVLGDGTTPTDPLNYYWTLADSGALADRWFQPIAGSTSSNDMYFAGARFRFVDNAKMADVVAGAQPTAPYGQCIDATLHCRTNDHVRPPYTGDIGSLLLAGGVSFSMYVDGFAEAAAAAQLGQCADPTRATECPYSDCIEHPVACHGCLYDPTDIPFIYFDTFADKAGEAGVVPTVYERDYDSLADDLAGYVLPSFAYVKARTYRNEHPNFSTISDGAAFVRQTIDVIEASAYRDSTLILVTWDEGGGFFDHVPPPQSLPASVDHDDQGAEVPYGTRVPTIAVGPFAAAGTVSHVSMEHSSIVKFLEWNFLGNARMGALGARDGVVANIGSLLDKKATIVEVPAE